MSKDSRACSEGLGLPVGYVAGATAREFERFLDKSRLWGATALFIVASLADWCLWGYLSFEEWVICGSLAHVAMGVSAYSNKTAEGLYVRLNGPDWLEQRAKLVHPSFTQAIDEHWSGRMLELNKVVHP